MRRQVFVTLVVLQLFSAARGLEITDGPELVMNPTGRTPLAGLVHVSTDEPSRVRLAVTGPAGTRAMEFPTIQTAHAVPLLGLTPHGSFTIDVAVTDEAGLTLTAEPSFSVVTPGLPDGFPLIDVIASEPLRMEPGFTLLDAIGLGANFVPGGRGFQIILGADGEVVWYATIGGSAVHKLANGHLLYRRGTVVYESDMLGNVIRTTQLDDPGTGLHHELQPTERGTFLSLTRETARVENYPTSNTDPNAPTETADVRDEPVVEFAPDGTLINRWSLVEMLDSTRVGYSTLGSLAGGGFDTFHTNAVSEDPADDGILVSVRHQDAVVKFSRVTGEIKWILGPHANWPAEFQQYLLEPRGAVFEWSYHQHAPMITALGTVMIFDNGNFRASPFDGTVPLEDADSFSRAVEYSIDEDAMQVRQVWDFGSRDTEWLYAGRVGDADRLPETGNVLITFGGTSYTNGVQNSDLGLGSIHTRIIEVTHDDPADKVFDVRLYNPSPDAPRAQVYRSDRISSLYPSTVKIDSDGDGATDEIDAFPLDPTEAVDTDSDGIGNNADPDDDGDGLSDSDELLHGFDPLNPADAAADADGDGVTNIAEVQAGTDPRDNPGDPAPVVSSGGSSLSYCSALVLICLARRRITTLPRKRITRSLE